MTSHHKIMDPADMVVTKQPMTGHPGAFIRDTLLPEYGLNVSEAARRLGIERRGLINVLGGDSSVSRELAYKIGALTRDEAADLLIAWQLKHDLENETARRAGYRETIARAEPATA
jgi:plasmid maintenance system antidote protein VapI